MKNRVLALLLCLIIALGFTACNNSKSEKQYSQQKTSIAKTVNKSSVYWTPNGKSYHTTKSCPTLSRSKVIKNTSLQRAYEEGKKDPCNTCVKQ
jgi:hypothetical protein